MIADVAAIIGFVREFDDGDHGEVVARPPAAPGEAWRSLPPAPIGGRAGHSMIWSGEEVIVWGGGWPGGALGDGAAYNPATDTWRTIAEAPLSGRYGHSAVWTGTEMVIVGGGTPDGGRFDDGAAYDPATDTWRRLPIMPAGARAHSLSAWTGDEVLIIAGETGYAGNVPSAAYNPATNRWRPVPGPPILQTFELDPVTSAVWSGSELVMVEQTPSLGAGPAHGDPGGSTTYEPREVQLPPAAAAYDPASDAWRLPPPPSPEVGMSLVTRVAWTGAEVVAV